MSDLTPQEIARYWQSLAPDQDADEITHLADGSSSTLFLARSAQGAAVIRVTTSAMIAVGGEAEGAAIAAQVAGAEGVGARVIHFDPKVELLNDLPVLITEYLPSPVDKAWLAQHAEQAADVLRGVHQSSALRSELERLQRGTSKSDALKSAREVLDWRRRVGDMLAARSLPQRAMLISQYLDVTLDRLELYLDAQRKAFRGKPLAAVHGEPLPYNWLLNEDGEPRLIDWDRAMIDDPAHDAAILLQSAFPRSRWQEVAAMIAPDDDSLLIRANVRYRLYAVGQAQEALLRHLTGADAVDAMLARVGPLVTELNAYERADNTID